MGWANAKTINACERAIRKNDYARYQRFAYAVLLTQELCLHPDVVTKRVQVVEFEGLRPKLGSRQFIWCRRCSGVLLRGPLT